MNLIFVQVEKGFLFREDCKDAIPKMWAFSTINEAVEWLRARHTTPPASTVNIALRQDYPQHAQAMARGCI